MILGFEEKISNTKRTILGVKNFIRGNLIIEGIKSVISVEERTTCLKIAPKDPCALTFNKWAIAKDHPQRSEVNQSRTN